MNAGEIIKGIVDSLGGWAVVLPIVIAAAVNLTVGVAEKFVAWTSTELDNRALRVVKNNSRRIVEFFVAVTLKRVGRK